MQEEGQQEKSYSFFVGTADSDRWKNPALAFSSKEQMLQQREMQLGESIEQNYYNFLTDKCRHLQSRKFSG